MDNERKTNGAIPVQVTVPTARLIELLKQGKEGDILSNEQLTEVCGRLVGTNQIGEGNLCTARKTILKDYGILWRRIRGADCIRCENDENKAELMADYAKGIRRKARRSLLVASTIKPDALTKEKQAALHTYIAQLGTVQMLTEVNTHKKLVLRGRVDKLSTDRLLAAFKE